MNRLLYWWYKRKEDKYLEKRLVRLAFMQFFSNVPDDKAREWTVMFHDQHTRVLSKLRKKYSVQ